MTVIGLGFGANNIRAVRRGKELYDVVDAARRAYDGNDDRRPGLRISTKGSQGSTVPIAQWQGNLMSNGNIADFIRTVRGFSIAARALSGNLK